MLKKFIKICQRRDFAVALVFKLLYPIILSGKGTFYIQAKLLRYMLKYAIKHCPYYRNYFKDQKSPAIIDFPIVDKKIISKNFDAFTSDEKDKFMYQHGYTGGSTGEPFHMLKYGGYEYGFGKKRWNVYGYQRGEVILAMDGSKIPDELLENNIYWIPKNKESVPFGEYALSSLYLSDENAHTYCNYIVDLAPDHLRGYPSFIYAIACFADKLGIDVGQSVKCIELTSESVFMYQIDKIKEVFRCRVFLQYGHTEACICANTFDDTYRYRIEPLYGYVEILDEAGLHVKEGEVGEVVVTSLYNYAMPLIRYKTGDYAVYGGNDSQYLYLDSVYGRTQDYIIDRKGNKVLLTALIFGQHIKAMAHVAQWQIEQHVEGTIVLSVVKTDQYDSNDEMEIRNLLTNLGNVSVDFRYVEQIPLTPRGKSKMLVQHLSLV